MKAVLPLDERHVVAANDFVELVAWRLERDVKGVHADVHTLLSVGLLRKTDDDRILFPYDAIHVDFTLRAA